MRIALIVEYDGSQYHGWQSQPGLHTVQGELEKALSQIATEPVSVICAGRTDTGVHATNQVVHFDSDKDRTVRAWIYGVNSFLPKDICVRWGKEVSDTFHARYSAVSRRYRYVIHNSPIRPALLRSSVTWQYRQLDHRLMHEAAQHLIGTYDFTSFRSVECKSKTPMRSVLEISVTRKLDFVVIDVRANAFLHHMVRNIAGVLMAVGASRHPVAWVKDVLEAKDRKLGAETAPPSGLYLSAVAYPKEFGLVEQFSETLFFDLGNT
ncbi:MAG: tRNA pseudouridine(38-40) synthase TruA [Gammaproteobacteria bacterium]|nr:tRNA pseudouridine(38-40) synthase TruA [Gammaproteobacteria bacterium]